MAILLEVSGNGWKNLAAHGELEGWQASCSAERFPRARYSVAVVARGEAEMTKHLVKPPPFNGRAGIYRERAQVVRIRFDQRSVTVGGFHMPNSVVDGGRDHSYKERCYRDLVDWIGRHQKHRLILGMDTNRGDWLHSTSRIKGHSVVAQTFVRAPEVYGLNDAYLRVHDLDGPDGQPMPTKPETWTSPDRKARGYCYDRIYVSQRVSACEAQIHTDAVDRHGDGLSDHAPVTATLDLK
ncbi:MAG: hypothetical protein KDA98_03800 [Acidimicrobiales bacterium]|nr:hypothetical protein [Acidimicrobiales bacterium]